MSETDEVEVALKVPVEAWRWLTSMAIEEVRDESNFLIWLIWKEVARRGYLNEQKEVGLLTKTHENE